MPLAEAFFFPGFHVTAITAATRPGAEENILVSFVCTTKVGISESHQIKPEIHII